MLTEKTRKANEIGTQMINEMKREMRTMQETKEATKQAGADLKHEHGEVKRLQSGSCALAALSY